MTRTGQALKPEKKKKAAKKKKAVDKKTTPKKAAAKAAKKGAAKAGPGKKAVESKTPAVLTGGCLCGQLRYRLTPLYPDVDYCHCAMCQKWSGAPVSAWAQVPASQFRLTRGTAASYASSKIGLRYFCPTCGASVFMTDETGVDVGVMLGTLDDPEALRPAAHGWWPERLSWLKLSDSLPHWPKDPPPPEAAR